MFIIKKHTNLHIIQHIRQAIYKRHNSATSILSSTQFEGNNRHGITTIQERFGQPTPQTHPHLLNKGELVAGIRVEEFKERRQKLMLGIQKYAYEQSIKKGEHYTNSNHMVIVPSATKKFMSDKIPYVFRQNSDFLYLTGCLEPDSLLLLSINERQEVVSILFLRPKEKHAELWDGPRTGVENAPHMFGVDEAYACDFFQPIYKKRTQIDNPYIWYDAKASEFSKINKDLGAVPANSSPSQFIQSLRLFKSTAEQNLMRRTCQIASTAINETICESKPGISEHHIFAMLDFKCRLQNASYLAYPPVVASGQNATVIHYVNNSQLTRSGDMVLVDAGCEYGGYTSDITRTWPINGIFTEPQRVLYDIVLTLQKDLIAMLFNEGCDTLDNVFESMCLKMGKYLQEAGLVAKDITDPMELGRAGYRFCPHHVSHYLGMDVHDTPLIPRNIRLLPGMVFTMEPGIYISNDRTDVPAEFRGLGVRIEDDLLVKNDKTIEVLTASCIKERIDLENTTKRKLG